MFYSDAAAPGITRMFKAGGKVIREDVEAAKVDQRVKAAIRDLNIARRYDFLLGLTGQG